MNESPEPGASPESPDLIFGERWDVYSALPTRLGSILDVGCGTGLGFQTYRQRGVRLVGVDVDPLVMDEASSNMDDVRLVDIEREEWPQDFQGAFDVVAFCDSLEHLNDPWKVLRSARSLLTKEGVVVASIPNIRQIRLLIKLILGKWDYVQGAGTIQRGHLRFFTRKTISDMFIEAGYEQPRFFFPSRTFQLGKPEGALNTVTRGLFSDFLYGAYTLQAKPAES